MSRIYSQYVNQGAERMEPQITSARCGSCGFAMQMHAPLDDASAYDEVRYKAQAHVKAKGHTVQLKRPAYGMIEVHSPGNYGNVVVNDGKNKDAKLTSQKYIGTADSRYRKQTTFAGQKGLGTKTSRHGTMGADKPVSTKNAGMKRGFGQKPGKNAGYGGKAEMYGRTRKDVASYGDDGNQGAHGLGNFDGET